MAPPTYGKTRWRGRWACGCMIISIEQVIEPRLRAAGMLGATEQVHVLQGAYNTGVSASADTHARGGALDHRKGSDAETKIWRQCGVADWQRGTPQDTFFGDHNHGIWQGCPHLSAGARRQLNEYRAGDDGLAGDGSDDSPHVTPITWQQAYNKYAKPLLDQSKGIPIMADAKEVRFSHAGQQLQPGGVRYVHINPEKHTSVVVGATEGAEVFATVGVEGLQEGEWVDVSWQIDWKTDTDTKVKEPNAGVTILRAPGMPARRYGQQIAYAERVPKADKGWVSCLRLVYATNSETAKIGRVQINGWKL